MLTTGDGDCIAAALGAGCASSIGAREEATAADAGDAAAEGSASEAP